MKKLNPQILITCAKAYERKLDAPSKWINAAQPPEAIYREIYDTLAQSPFPKAMRFKILTIRDFGETDLSQLGSITQLSRLACFLKQYRELGDCLVNSIGLSENEARKIIDNPFRKYSYIAGMFFLYLASSIAKSSFKSRVKRGLKFKLRQLRWKLEDFFKRLRGLFHKVKLAALSIKYFLLAHWWRLRFSTHSFWCCVKYSEIFTCIEDYTWRALNAKWWRLKNKTLCLRWKLKNSKLVKFYFG